MDGSLARVERRLDAALEEIKSLIQGMTLQNNELRSQFANHEAEVTK